MNEKDMFPDYEPKRTPDTVHDYLRGPSIVHEVLGKIGEASLENLNNIITLFKEYKTKADHNPGTNQRGNIALGADLDQYYPSDEEIITSELGNMIRQIILGNSKEKIGTFKTKNNIPSQELEFHEIYYRHVDVMGSGRFFYAEKRKETTIITI